MKKHIFKYLFITLVSISSFGQSKQAQLDELLTTYANMYQFNGSAQVDYKGETLLKKGYGYSNIDSKTLNTEQTIFQIGSITKQFTSTVILKLEEEGKLRVTDKLSQYFPDFPNGNDITIEHLLTHTSGIFNYTNDADFMKSEAVKPADEKTILALFKNRNLDFLPGTKWSYSNSGYMLLGYIIQKVTGKPYEDAVRKYIISPLKMNHTGFDFVGLKDKNKATGYFVITEKTNIPSTLVDSTVSYAAGAIYTTTDDMLKWHNGLMNNTIISRNQLQKAFTPVKNKYGYGWVIDSIYGHRMVTHSGGIFGFNANFARIEADNISISLLNNVGNPKLNEITQSILAILYDKPYTLPKTKVEVQVSEDILKKYIGLYEMSPQFYIEVMLEKGQLIAQATGQPRFELYAQKDNYFFLKAVEAEIEFDKNEKGDVGQLFLYQGGRKMTAKKVK